MSCEPSDSRLETCSKEQAGTGSNGSRAAGQERLRAGMAGKEPGQGTPVQQELLGKESGKQFVSLLKRKEQLLPIWARISKFNRQRLN